MIYDKVFKYMYNGNYHKWLMKKWQKIFIAIILKKAIVALRTLASMDVAEVITKEKNNKGFHDRNNGNSDNGSLNNNNNNNISNNDDL